MGEVVGELDHRLHAGGLDHLVRPLRADDGADLRRQVARVPVELRQWVAPRARAMASLPSNEIDRDDRVGAGERGELHDVQADAADAEHHHRLADLAPWRRC